MKDVATYQTPLVTRMKIHPAAAARLGSGYNGIENGRTTTDRRRTAVTAPLIGSAPITT